MYFIRFDLIIFGPLPVPSAGICTCDMYMQYITMPHCNMSCVNIASRVRHLLIQNYNCTHSLSTLTIAQQAKVDFTVK